MIVIKTSDSPCRENKTRFGLRNALKILSAAEKSQVANVRNAAQNG